MINKQTFKTALLIVIACSLNFSCASIFKGSSADVRINSNPAGADIFINGIDRGQTPQTLSLKRNQSYVLTFKKEGYEDLNFEVAKKFDIGTTVVGNIFSWGLVGIIVDVATGAAYSLTPADVEANLESMQQAGIIDAKANLKKGEIFAFMLTKEQWEEIKASK